MKNAGFYNIRVTVRNRGEATMGPRGQEEGKYEDGKTYWGRVIWQKGSTRLKEQALDPVAKGTLYLRYHEDIDADTHFVIGGKEYQQDGPPIVEPNIGEIQTVIRSMTE